MADDSPAVQPATSQPAAAQSTTAQSSSTPSESRGRGNNRSRGGGGRGRGNDRGRGGRGRGDGSKGRGGRERKRDVGRKEFESKRVDKRQRNQDEQEANRRKLADGTADESLTPLFSREEIEAEGRKPKHKVAVLIGYAGSGYKGMQINGAEKTIEGDLFKAFVAAGAISKANADDPKKSSLVRCARTDKGVHAAGNVISLKLIVEEPDIVQKINTHLPPQIRVWGIERTNGAFSCYQSCDSRWYEYLIPTYSFLPPHPRSFLGKKMVESAEKEGIHESYKAFQEDVASFWADTEEKYVKPILDKLDPELREAVMDAIHSPVDEKGNQAGEAGSKEPNKPEKESAPVEEVISGQKSPTKRPAEEPLPQDKPQSKRQKSDQNGSTIEAAPEGKNVDITGTSEVSLQAEPGKEETVEQSNSLSVLTPLQAAVKEVKAAYITAKEAYRISESRKARVQEALDCYLGTRNFHNYTIQKKFADPSAKRVIRSFKLNPEPVNIKNTEWLSLKVHGQSFMMHQIRKMVAMVALVVRCGSTTNIITDSYGPANISIPKAPGLGLLLERPVFDSYNNRAVTEFTREKIDFDKFEKEMNEFKQREIYDRLFEEEERDHQFHSFFHHIDHFCTDYFLWVTAGGISAAKQSKSITRRAADDSDDEQPDVKGEEG